MAAIGRNKKAPHAARVSAWNAILDRGFGKPLQSIDDRRDNRTASEMTTEELEEILAEAGKRDEVSKQPH